MDGGVLRLFGYFHLKSKKSPKKKMRERESILAVDHVIVQYFSYLQ